VRALTWAVRLTIFVLLVAFAAKNADPVTLRFYFDLALQAPLVLVLFGSFAAGALFGMLALIGTLLRQRREIASLNKQSQSSAPPPVAGM
jgi:uncharacterized integral membrane protein